jgi:hypothetical protein
MGDFSFKGTWVESMLPWAANKPGESKKKRKKIIKANLLIIQSKIAIKNDKTRKFFHKYLKSPAVSQLSQ